MRLWLVIVVKLVNHLLLLQSLLTRTVLCNSLCGTGALGVGLQLHSTHLLVAFIVEGCHIDGAADSGDFSSVPISWRCVIISISVPLVIHAALSPVYIIDILVVETLKVNFVIMCVKLLNVNVLTFSRALLLLAPSIDLVFVSLMLGRSLLWLAWLELLVGVVRLLRGRISCCCLLAIV